MFLVQTTIYYQILTRRLNVFVSVLDGKSAQNLSILLGGSLKYLSYDDIKRAILHCDESVLSDSVLQQLIQYMPTPEQLKKLEEYKEQYDSLAEAEQFSVTVTHHLPYSAFSNFVPNVSFLLHFFFIFSRLTVGKYQEAGAASQIHQLQTALQ